MSKEVFFRSIAIDLPETKNLSFGNLRQKIEEAYPNAQVAPAIGGTKPYSVEPQPIKGAPSIDDGRPWLVVTKTTSSFVETIQFSVNKIILMRSDITTKFEEETSLADEMAEQLRCVAKNIGEYNTSLTKIEYTINSAKLEDEKFSVNKLLSKIVQLPNINSNAANNVAIAFSYNSSFTNGGNQCNTTVQVEISGGNKVNTKKSTKENVVFPCLLVQETLTYKCKSNCSIGDGCFDAFVKSATPTTNDIYEKVIVL